MNNLDQRNSEWCRKLVPKMSWSMSEGAVSDFEWWWWFDESDIRWRACVVTVRMLNIDTRSYRYGGWVVLRILWEDPRGEFSFFSAHRVPYNEALSGRRRLRGNGKVTGGNASFVYCRQPERMQSFNRYVALLTQAGGFDLSIISEGVA